MMMTFNQVTNPFAFVSRLFKQALRPQSVLIAFKLIIVLLLISSSHTAQAAVNLALNKTATQSSTDYNGPANLAVDGNYSGIYTSGSVSHTRYETMPWWQVDLGQSYQIGRIQISNRTDICCDQRLVNFYVFVSETDLTGRTLQSILDDPTVARRYYADPAPAVFQISDLNQGRYVRVQLAGTGYLSLAEVDVLDADLNATGPGPGIPSLTFNDDTVGSIISVVDPEKSISFVQMHNGYLFVPLGADHGGGTGDGAFAFYDIEDPRNPILIADSRQDSARFHSRASQDYVGDWSEGHALPMSGNLMVMATKNGGAGGINIVDMSGLPEQLPRTIGKATFPGVNNGNNYNGYSFALAMLGNRYVYAPTGYSGMFIYDIQDPTNPVMVRYLSTSELGSSEKRAAKVIGHWLILSTVGPQMTDDTVIYDISNPIDPIPLGSFRSTIGYHDFICGSEFFNIDANGPLASFDFSDPANIRRTVYNADAAQTISSSPYGFCQDGRIFTGHYSGLSVWDSRLPGSPLEMNIYPTPANDDYATVTPLGNMVVITTDHNTTSRLNLAVHQGAPDTTPPAVDFVLPQDGSTNNKLGSKVGIVFSDFPDTLSVNENTLQVRPVLPNGNLGAPISGSVNTLNSVANFLPNQPLSENTTYKVILLANGIKDWAGNAIASEIVASTFSTGNVIDQTVGKPTMNPVNPDVVGSTTFLSVDAQATSAQYAWDFGDGSPKTAYSKNTAISHTYNAPGNYRVTLSIRTTSGEEQQYQTVTITNPLPAQLPVHSSTIIYEQNSAQSRVWNVNPDNNTVTAIDAANHTKVFEVAVGKSPQSLALTGNGLLWVVNKEDASISEISTATGAVQRTIALAYGAAPHGLVIDQSNDAAYVSLEGRSSVAKLALDSGAILGELPIRAWPRNLALDLENQRLFVAHFISSETQGNVSVIDIASGTLAQEIALLPSTTVDNQFDGSGLPNYLGALALSPDLTQALVPSKKDNITRGTMRNGKNLTFEHTVRSMAAQIDLNTLSENVSNRIDFDNNDFATAAIYSPLGNRIFVTTNGSEEIWSIDAYDPTIRSSLSTGGKAPKGMVMSPDGHKLFVHNFMSRNVAAFDVDGNSIRLLARVGTVAHELLTPQVLQGKQLFYNTTDVRLTQDNYMSCASCHSDGGHDGRTWDLTGFGEGLRNTISLKGHGGPEHGRLHWSGNFDEVHDFEHQIRNLNRGLGLLSDADFAQHDQPLGSSKAGLSADLDALAAYVNSLNTFGQSPYRTQEGQLTASAIRGRTVFNEKNCASCHAGKAFTDSAQNLLHNIGTIKPHSGQRLAGPLDGLDTPTLVGLWNTAPYLHDGSAATLSDAVQAHDNLSITQEDLAALVDYLRQIDDKEVGNVTSGAPSITLNAPISSQGNVSGSIEAIASDADGIAKVEFYYNGNNLLSTLTSPPYIQRWNNVADGHYTITAKAYDNTGAMATSNMVTVIVDRSGDNNQAPTVLLKPATGGPSFVTGSIEAEASDADGTVTKVEIYYNGNLIRTLVQAPYLLNWQGVPNGRYELSAKAYDNAGAVSNSNTVTVEVNNGL